MDLIRTKLAIVGSVILIIVCIFNPVILRDKDMRSQTEIIKVAGQGSEWDNTYGGTEDDETFALIQTSDGGFALAGYTYSYGEGDGDMWLVKTDEDGVKQWDQTYGGTGRDLAFALVQTADGGFSLAGNTYSYEEGDGDMWLVKTDADGVKEWNQTYGGTGYDLAFSLLQTADGGFVLAGYTYSYGEGGADMWLVKTDADGTEEWNQTFGGTGDDEAIALIQTTDGGFALAGDRVSLADDMWLVKTDADGKMEWDQTYGGAGYDLADTLIQTADGGFVLAGCTGVYGSNSDMMLVKTDANGVKQWDQTYGGWGEDLATFLIQTADGGLALSGVTTSYGKGGADMWLVKTDKDGTKQWDRTYGGRGKDAASDLIQTSDGGFVLAGYTSSYGAGQNDIWLVKTDSIKEDTGGNGFLKFGILSELVIMVILMYSYRMRKRNHILK